MMEGNGGRDWQCFLNGSWQRVNDSFSDAQHPSLSPSSAPRRCEGSGNEGRKGTIARANCKSRFCSFLVDLALRYDDYV